MLASQYCNLKSVASLPISFIASYAFGLHSCVKVAANLTDDYSNTRRLPVVLVVCLALCLAVSGAAFQLASAAAVVDDATSTTTTTTTTGAAKEEATSREASGKWQKAPLLHDQTWRSSLPLPARVAWLSNLLCASSPGLSQLSKIQLKPTAAAIEMRRASKFEKMKIRIVLLSLMAQLSLFAKKRKNAQSVGSLIQETDRPQVKAAASGYSQPNSSVTLPV